MSERNRQRCELRSLIQVMLDGSISDADFDKLRELVNSNAELRYYYVDYMSLCAALKRYGSANKTHQPELSEPEMTDLWQQLVLMEKTARTVEIEPPPVKAAPVREPIPSRCSDRHTKTSRMLAMTAILSATAFLFMFVYLFFIPEGGPVVATVGNSYEAQWSGSGEDMKVGKKLQTGIYKLLSGFAEIDLESGTSVLIHGPAEVEFEGKNTVFLWQGSVSCKVPKEAVGFIVRTPRATVVDYGTEFGVKVGKAGQTQAHVFEGQVELRKGIDPVVFDGFLRLNKNESGVVNANDSLARQNYSDSLFVRDLDSLLSSHELMDKNLIVNGDFESGPVGEPFDNGDITNIVIEGWMDEAPATIFSYSSESQPFPQKGRDPLPPDCGDNFFVGRDDCLISQEIDLKPLTYLIDRSEITYQLSAWLGGFKDHGDSATIEVDFLDSSGKLVGSEKLEPSTPEERNNETRFINRSKVGRIPIGTRKATVTVSVVRTYGVADAYVDNIELIVREAGRQ
ncbi:FecR protein [Anaerohalosphaera lusitana]|uniref:FecR protein n=1 Tax=Anaerohalosphaera lusitana TaxID=1936003 RepID=A0A1U9NJ84_9BACT|nr:FecR family protein [Anaerohalosphaera lusitana]AQT67885.1 FecR protein [Anaerohalosphaera lusitana]